MFEKKDKVVILIISLFLTTASLADIAKNQLFDDHKDKTALQIARLLGDKFLTSKPQVYYHHPAYAENTMCPWSYPTGVTFWSLSQLYDVSGDEKYLDFVSRHFDYFYDNYLQEAKVPNQTLGVGGMMGHSIWELNKRWPDPRYIEVVENITDFYEHNQPRLPDGTFCHWREPQKRRIWIDALFCVCPIQAKSAELFNKPQYYDDAVSQILSQTSRLQDPDIKLYYQGWGWGINSTAHSPGFWSRGNGWVMMTMTETLKTLPENHPQREKLLGIYKDFAAAVLKVQNPSGRWHQLLTRPDSFEETSGTAMFIYAFIEGYKNGWLSKEYKDAALKGFEGLKQKIDHQGNIYGTCIGTGSQNTIEDYYKRKAPVNDEHGIGPVILAASAVSSLDKTDLKD